jgi:hypothetical protein
MATLFSIVGYAHTHDAPLAEDPQLGPNLQKKLLNTSADLRQKTPRKLAKPVKQLPLPPYQRPVSGLARAKAVSVFVVSGSTAMTAKQATQTTSCQ